MNTFNASIAFAGLLIWASNLLLSPELLVAQEQCFIDETINRLPEREDRSRDGAFGDLDGDGYLDIVIATPRESSFRSYSILNDGLGNYPEDNLQDLLNRTYNFSSIDLGDIERDGDLDLLFTGYNDMIILLVNEGGQFLDGTEERLPWQSGSWSAKDGAFVDVDGDMYLDIVFVQYGTGRIWINDGEGIFDFTPLDQFSSEYNYSNAFAWGDVDGDFDLDCVIASNTGFANKLMINDGTGWFSDETEERLPIETSPSNGIAMVDVDGDKDLDIVVGSGTPPGYNKVWINDGSGHFVDESDERLPYVWDTSFDMTFGDVDNDHDFDLFVANNGLNNRFNRLLINVGEGYFTDETAERFPFAEETTLTMPLGDVDRDGDFDCFVVNFGEFSDVFPGQNRLLINQSTPDSFPPTIQGTFHYPDTGDTTNPYLLTASVWDNTSIAVGELKVSLFYRTVVDTTKGFGKSEFLEILMVDCGGFLYRERIPAQISGKVVEYYIKAEDWMGNISYDPPNAPDSVFSFLVDVSVGINNPPSTSSPKTFSLSQNYPNPFNPSTTIHYSLPGDQTVPLQLKIYDLRGRLIRTLVNEEKHPGQYSVHWDGMDERGMAVTSGTYIYRLMAGDFSSCKKMVLVR